MSAPVSSDPRFALVGRMSREPRLAGKVAVISGASRGFGQGIAIRFVEEGARVVLLSRGDCDETLRLIASLPGLTKPVAEVAVWVKAGASLLSPRSPHCRETTSRSIPAAPLLRSLLRAGC